MSYRTDFKGVHGLGSARTGAEEWWKSRVLSAALVPLTILFLVMVAPLVGESRETVLTAFTNPLRAVITILFIVVSFKHLADGLHEVIVDYVHGQPMLTALLVGTKLGSYFVGAVGAFAVVVIAFIGITTG